MRIGREGRGLIPCFVTKKGKLPVCRKMKAPEVDNELEDLLEPGIDTGVQGLRKEVELEFIVVMGRWILMELM